jgi:hypothetical protein
MTNNKQQTAVDSIIAKLNNVKPTEFCSIETIKEWCKQAKEMEKAQMIDSVSSPTKMSDESWEGCDGCTEQDEIMYNNGYVKGYNAAISELPKETNKYYYEK